MSEYLLTIAVPTYNGANTISRMLSLLLPQCNEQVEVLVVDNASTDNTGDIVKAAIKHYPFVEYVRNEKNIGPDSNFLKCMNLAQGKYTLLLSDDDVLMEGKLKYILELLAKEEMSLVYLNAKGFYETYVDEQHCISYERAIYDNRVFSTSSTKKFMDYAGRMWGFLSCFICNTKVFKSLSGVEKYKGSNWLQSYIHIMCASNGPKKLGIVGVPCIGAGIYSIVSNFDSARVDGKSYREMLDFAIEHGFDKKQLDELYQWRVCFISKRAIVKERAAGTKKTSIKGLFDATWKYPYCWIHLYPYFFAPRFVCRIAVEQNKKKKNYKDDLHVNRVGDVQG